MTDLTILMTPRRAALEAGRPNTLDVLVRVQAPAQPKAAATRTRADINLALVIDRSGSMEGKPIRHAVKAARHIVDHLGATDRCAIVVYDGEVNVLVPAIGADDKTRLHAALDRVTARGSTDLHGGWLTGAETLAPFAAETGIARVLVLSDGNANQGLTDTAEIVRQAERLAATGVTTSTLGLGAHFNEQLMSELARAGRGRAYYGETADDLMGPFREEFDLLNAIAARKIAFTPRATPGIGVEVLNDYPRDAQGRLVLPDIAWNAEAWVMLRLTVPAHMLATARMIDVLSCTVAFTDLDGKPHAIGSGVLNLPIMDPAAFGAIAEDELVIRRTTELRAAAIQIAAREAALHENWDEVERLLGEMKTLAADHAWIRELLQVVKDIARRRDRMAFSKETMYASHSLRTRLASLAESESLDVNEDERAFIARKLRHGKGRMH